MRLSQDAIRRMVGNGNGFAGGGGGGGSFDPSVLAGYATQAWTEENYISKTFFNELFVIHKKVTTVVMDGETEISRTVTTDSIFAPNEIPGTTTETDEETGYVTTVTTEISSIESKKGFWTNYFLSALGLNGEGGGGGGVSSLSELSDVQLSSPSNGQALIYDSALGKWRNGAAGMNVSELTTYLTSKILTVKNGSATLGTWNPTAAGVIDIASAVSGYLPLTGGNLTGNLGIIFPHDLSKTDNGVTSTLWPGYRIYDKDGRRSAQFVNGVYSSGSNFVWMGVSNYDTNGNMIADYGIGLSVDKNGVGTWSVSEPAAFRTAIGIPALLGGYLPLSGGTLSISSIGGFTIKNTTSNYPLIRFEGNTGGGLGFIGFGKTGSVVAPYYVTADANGGYTDGVSQWNFLLHSGNYTDYTYSKSYIDTELAKKLDVDFFDALFQAYAGSTKVTPNASTSSVDNIKAMFGFWTQQYISALGQNSGGGGGGTDLNEPLASINDAGLGVPTAAGQVLTWNGSQWVYNIPGGGGGGGTGTVTSITAGTGLSGGTITTMGTIAINSTYQGYIQHGETAYGWGNHASAGYATPNSVATQMQNYAYISNGAIHIGNNSITPLTSHQSVYGTFWGKSWSNGGTVNGNIEAGNNGGAIEGFHSIELNTHGTLTDYGGFIDFHFNGSSGDYTSRIIEDASGRIRLMADNGVRIGNGVLLWDETNNALKVQRYDGTASNLYTTGGVSALGMSAGASSIDAMTFNYINVNNQLKFGTNDVTMYVDDMFYIESSYDISINGVEMFNNYVSAKRLYLDSTRYLFISSGKLYFYNGSTNKEIAFTN